MMLCESSKEGLVTSVTELEADSDDVPASVDQPNSTDVLVEDIEEPRSSDEDVNRSGIVWLSEMEVCAACKLVSEPDSIVGEPEAVSVFMPRSCIDCELVSRLSELDD